AKEELSESESVKPEDVKDELYDEQVKDEIKEEVKEESDEDQELYDSSSVKSEVKEECEEEIKQEPGVHDSNWIKMSECKEEFYTKVKKEPTIKREPPDGFSEASRPLPFKRRRINVKSEPTEFGVSSPLASPPPPLFTKMLPGWIQLYSKLVGSYHRLTKPQQREFRRYIESGEEDHAVAAKLAAENAVARPSSKGSSKEPVHASLYNILANHALE
ncbi:unnamed protein product, partial [Polarella glacialis]